MSGVATFFPTDGLESYAHISLFFHVCYIKQVLEVKPM